MLGSCLKFKYFFLKFLLLRLQYTIVATATITSTRRTTANGANNTGQRLAGRMARGLVKREGRMLEEEGITLEGEGITLDGKGTILEGEGITLERRLVEAVEVISIKAIYNSD